MQIKGVVDSIIFQNMENGYAVIDLDSDGELVTAVGTFMPVTEGEELTLIGEYANNSRYGKQFIVENVTTSLPESEEGIVRYLSSGLFKGIGPVSAASIVEKFKGDTLKILENNPILLADCKGISRKKAKEIGEAYGKLREMQEVIIYLQSYSVSIGLAIKIYRCYGTETVNLLQKNPYQMVDDIDGIGFVTADKIAESMGVPHDSEFRIKAGIIYLLSEASTKGGHTYLVCEELISATHKLLGLNDGANIEEAIDGMCFMDTIKRMSDGEKEIIVLSRFYYLEKGIASKVVRLVNEFTPLHIDIERDIADYEIANNIKLHSKQIEAIVCAVGNGVFVLTGGPGTGKTTIIRCIIHILKFRGLKFGLCAPTGRAAKRMSEATGEEAKTIHRLLDLDFRNGKGHFTYNENTTLESDVIIVDEVSMADVYVFNALIRAIKRGGRLIIVGDRDQLPSVGAGNVLADIIKSGFVPVVCLEYIYRQEDNSLITENAHKINSGIMPILDSNNRDFFFSEKQSSEEILETVKEMVVRRIPSYMKIEPQEIQVLTAMKKGISGVNNINKELQAVLNHSEGGIHYGDTIFRKGDKVMQIVNNYKLEWTRNDNLGDNEHGVGVFNGDIGTIVAVDIANSELTVLFEDGRMCNYIGDLSDLTLAYAISIHKSQGCEFDVVIIAVYGGNPQILTRNLLYTAITRAKKMVVIVGDKATLRRMVNNNFTARRYSLLCNLINEESRKYGEIYANSAIN